MTYWKSANEQSFWISALCNRSAVSAMMVENGRESLHILCDRLADRYLTVPRGRRSTSFMPIYNPQDHSQWPELLGWLVSIGEMVKVED